jgi:predicted nucleotide-binding protein (sugar kinase/HSP70/actin superfamily)
MRRLAIPNIGNYAVALAALGECLGVKSETCLSITPEMMTLGTQYAPETCCLPLKAYLGHFIKAAREGVEYAVMVNSIGRCRLRYYGKLQQKILADMGLNMRVFGLGYDGIKPPLIRFFDPTLRQVLHGGACYVNKLVAIDILEVEAWRTRPRELNPGDTSQLFKEALKELDEFTAVRDIRKFRKIIRERFAAVQVDATRPVLRIGLLGECSVLRDKYLNHNIEEMLGNLGAEVRNFFLMGNELKTIFNLGMLNKHSRKNQLKKTRGHLHALVGGHALDSVANAIRCAEEGYDGVVHICPAGCMPEVSIRPILRQACKDRDFSLLELSFDEHTGHEGVCTRIEAFVDILWEKRKLSGLNKG